MKIATLLQEIKMVTAVKFLIYTGFVISLSTSTAFAAAYCITNPNGNPPENEYDARCAVTATIYPESSSISSGSSVGIILYAETLYQWWVNGLVDMEASMTDTVTGANTVLSTGPGYITGTWSQNVPSGPLTHSASLSIWAESDQGVIGSDSSYITVITVAAPTVDIHFSFLQKLNNFFSNI